jgi:hypothetical protein
MLKLLLTISLFSGALSAGAQAAPGKAAAPAKPAQAIKYTRYNMESFTCEIPGGWEMKRDKEKELKTKIRKLELSGPRAENAPVLIYAAHYLKGSAAFADYKDFIERNSKNILGETKSDTEKFSPVKETSLAGKKAFEFDSEIKEYLHPESKSDESVMVKEKFYVVPAKDGFFVLHYYSPAASFNKHLPVFKKLVSTFKPL